MKLAAILLIIGTALWGYAFKLQLYKNEALFMERYLNMTSRQSDEYWKLRDEMLTPKYQLEDYGITLVATSLLVFLATWKNRIILRAPSSRKILVVLAIVLPFVSVGGYLFDLFQALFRHEIPHWADSIGIVLIGVPVQFAIMLIWSLAHLSFLRGEYRPSTFLVQGVSLKSNWWLLFVSAIAALLTLSSAALGQYWYALPGVLWLYFYLSLAAGRGVAKGT